MNCWTKAHQMEWWVDHAVLLHCPLLSRWKDSLDVWGYQSTVDEWAKLINAPEEHEDDLGVYATKKKDHNSMANMYKDILDKALETYKLGSIHFLLSGLPTINWILRNTLLPKSGYHKMIRGHSINMLQIFYVPQKFKVMSLLIETIKRTAADQKRSCGYAPHI